jgi:hypothetical protein
MSVARVLRTVVTLGCCAVLLASCGYDSSTDVRPRSVRRLVAAADAEICAQGTTPTHSNDQRSARWYEVSRDCSKTEGSELLIGVLRFDTDAARDAAYADRLHAVRRLSNNTAVFKAADSLVVLGRIRDRSLLDDVAAELQ